MFSRKENGDRHYVHPCVGADGEGRVEEVYKKLSG